MCKFGIIHLAYADDLLLFERGYESIITLIADYLKEFGDVVGLRQNLQKSSIYFTRVDEQLRGKLLDIIGFQQGSFPFRYLGIPLAMEKLCSSNYETFTGVVVLKLTSWANHTLSYVGKLELVKTILQGVECFWLSILSIPCGVIDKLYAIYRSFV